MDERTDFHDQHNEQRSDEETGRDRSREQPPQGPQRPEHIAAREQLRDAESFEDAASYQTRPRRDMPARARVTETGTAERSERAAGARPHEHHAEDTQRAFDESRGDRQPRDDGSAGGSNR